MSISFEENMNDETRELIEKQFGDKIKLMDKKNVLLERLNEGFKQDDFKEIANTAKQPVTLELHGGGEIKTMSDGTQYQVTKSGWVKVKEKP